VRLTMDSLLRLPAPTVVVLNRFDEGSELHQRNRSWLREHDLLQVFRTPGDETELAKLVRTVE
jgi:hypothetical protein